MERIIQISAPARSLLSLALAALAGINLAAGSRCGCDPLGRCADCCRGVKETLAAGSESGSPCHGDASRNPPCRHLARREAAPIAEIQSQVRVPAPDAAAQAAFHIAGGAEPELARGAAPHYSPPSLASLFWGMGSIASRAPPVSASSFAA